jgi:hypothetical protein
MRNNKRQHSTSYTVANALPLGKHHYQMQAIIIVIETAETAAQKNCTGITAVDDRYIGNGNATKPHMLD